MNAQFPCPAREGETMTHVDTIQEPGDVLYVFDCTCYLKQHWLHSPIAKQQVLR